MVVLSGVKVGGERGGCRSVDMYGSRDVSFLGRVGRGGSKDIKKWIEGNVEEKMKRTKDRRDMCRDL